VLEETDRVAFAPSCHYSLRPLVERTGMHEPSSSHPGATWSGALGRVLAPVRREQDRYQARGSLRPCIHYATFATHEELKRSRLNIINVAVRKMRGQKPAFSHGSLAMFKWTVCHHWETVCLPEVRCETDVVLSGNEQGGWRMDDALNAMGVERPPRGPL
jgi:hypothetical protein